MPNNNIKCPHCGNEFPVEDAFFVQAEERIKKEYEIKILEQTENFKKQKNDLEKQRSEFEKEKESAEEILSSKLEERLRIEKEKLTKSVESDFEEKIKSLEEENAKRKFENKLLKQKELDLLKRENELQEQKEEIELQIEKQLLEKRNEIIEQIKIQENEKNTLKFREYEKKLEDQKKLIDEMQRKADQGSMQLQGEIQELALEELLRIEYPFDIVEEVPKGVSGADLIHTIVNQFQQVCGKIIYESKRTKSFSDTWIEKLKEDQRNQNADVALIISETLPRDIQKFGRRDGVWICSFEEVKSLTFVLREMIIKTHSVKSAEENKGDKMNLLYNYLISEDFRHRVEAIVEGFSTMKGDLEKEKRALQKIWKEREKQIDKVITNTIDMYGSIKGIAGNSIGTVEALELPYSSDSEFEEIS